MLRVIFFASLQLPEEWPRGYYISCLSMDTELVILVISFSSYIDYQNFVQSKPVHQYTRFGVLHLHSHMCSMSSSYRLITYHLILLSSHQLAKPNVHCASMWPMSTVYFSLSAMTLSHELMSEPDPCIAASVSKLQSSVSRYVTRKDVTGSTLHRRHFKYEFQEP